MRSERCCICDGPTGRAGRSEDSLYCDGCDTGPYCLECWDDHHAGNKLRDEVARFHKEVVLLEAAKIEAAEQITRLRAALGTDRCKLLDALSTESRKVREMEPALAREKERRIHWQDLAYKGMILVDDILHLSLFKGAATTEANFAEDTEAASQKVRALEEENEGLTNRVVFLQSMLPEYKEREERIDTAIAKEEGDGK